MVQLRLEHRVDEPVEAGGGRQTDEAREQLRVDDAGRLDPVAQPEGEQVAGRRVHHDLDVGIGHELGDRLERRSLQRIHERDVLVDGDLDEAELRRVRALPEELRVERDAVRGSGAGGDLLDSLAVHQHQLSVHHRGMVPGWAPFARRRVRRARRSGGGGALRTPSVLGLAQPALSVV